jgi:hypothetical protein
MEEEGELLWRMLLLRDMRNEEKIAKIQEVLYEAY